VLEDPGLDPRELAAALRTAWAVEASGFTFVRGHDMRAAAYEVAAGDDRFFLKVRFGPAPEAPLEVPRALLDAGIASVLAPQRTAASALWHDVGDGRTLVLYPFVAGRNAVEAGMTAGQWRTFGTTLRAIHDSGLAVRFAGRLPAETFGLPSAAVLREVLGLAQRPPIPSPAGQRLGTLLRGQADRIGTMIGRATELGESLCGKSFAHVLCHADIHAANVLVADDGRILLVDWDGPMLAPRERDLMFVIGSRIARTVEPHEQAWFFEGYGDIRVDPNAIVYYRYERIIEDLGEFGTSVFRYRDLPEASREDQVALAESLFEPGGDVETAEVR
jgi:spectinomycin phosphotransferase